MAQFILTYPGEVVKTGVFGDIRRVIKVRGTPTSLRFEIDQGNFEANFANGYFYINNMCVRPAECDLLLTDRKVEYRPIWFRRWYHTFEMGTGSRGEIGAYWILFLGWQFTENGRNFKRMIQIHQDGTVGVG